MLERRLQLLIDQARYARVANEAERTGQSVSGVIRSCIDAALPDEPQRKRIDAAFRFLELAGSSDDASALSSIDLHSDLDQDRDDWFERLSAQ